MPCGVLAQCYLVPPMSTERDMLPLRERQAARAAIEDLVREHGSQMAAGAAIGLSQAAISKALQWTKVGPSVMRTLLQHLNLTIEQLLERYGSGAVPAEDVPALPAKEEAILTAIRFAPTATEVQIRAIANEYDTVLREAPPIDWLETLLREIQRRIVIPQRHEKNVVRRQRSEQRQIRKLRDMARPQESAAPATAKAKRSSG